MIQATVIIPFFERTDALVKTIKGLECQTTLPNQFEVLVVDDGTSDRVSSSILNLSLPFALKFIHQQHSGPAAARNNGAKNAGSELLVFLDADMIPHANLMSVYIRALEKHPNAALIGRQLPWPESYQTKFTKVYNYIDASDLGVDERSLKFYHLTSGNFSISRSVLKTAGWFDESLRMTEDTELGYRLQVAGSELIYLPAAIGYHNHPKTFSELCSNAHTSAQWTGIMMQKHQPIQGTIPVYLALEPISANDPFALKATKLFKILLAKPISRHFLKLAVRVFATMSLSPRIQRKMYNIILEGYRYTGLQIGLMNDQFTPRNKG